MHSSCRHYQAINQNVGTCAVDAFGGGTVSPGACLMACEVYDGNENLRRAYRRKIALTVYGIDPATMEPAGVQVVRWLGIDWIGEPWPRRLRPMRQWPFVHVRKFPGCGCIMRLKMAWTKLRRPKSKGCGCRK